jgi:hypothetical protein
MDFDVAYPAVTCYCELRADPGIRIAEPRIFAACSGPSACNLHLMVLADSDEVIEYDAFLHYTTLFGASRLFPVTYQARQQTKLSRRRSRQPVRARNFIYDDWQYCSSGTAHASVGHTIERSFTAFPAAKLRVSTSPWRPRSLQGTRPYKKTALRR